MVQFQFEPTSLHVAFGALVVYLLLKYVIINTRTGRIRKGSDIHNSLSDAVLRIRAAQTSLTQFASSGVCLPPGPPAKLIGGNAKDMPSHHEWETYDRWAKEYGPIVYVNVYGKHMVILNTMEVAQDLCERRSSIYSDRIEFPMLELMGWNFSFVMMRYGEQWRRHRRMFNEKFHAKASMAYHPTHVKQTKTLLRSYYYSPGKFRDHLRYLAGATILEIVYGIQARPTGDPFIEVAEQAMAGLSAAGNPGTFLVDTIPILKHVPEWVPGASFKKKARYWRNLTESMGVAPLTEVKKAMEAGTAATESVAFSLLEKLANKHDDAPADEEEVIRDTTAVAYAAGTDTTFVALSTFMLAMILYPEVQKKAQAELDSVVGMDRLPKLDDRKNLPYVSAIHKEVHRWHPTLPLGVAHRSTRDDVYGKYFIPGGSTVFINAWSILRDEKAYGPRTDEFEPERFLRGDIIDPVAQFGLGRRICPGRYVADNSMWLAIASILHAFDISPARDEDGKEIPADIRYESGLISGPESFPCSIVPRSARVTSLILESNEQLN